MFKENLMKIFLFFISVFILILPSFTVLKFIQNISSTNILILSFAPLVFIVVYILSCCAIAILFRQEIVEGTFPRKLSNFTYMSRRVYGLCWSMISNFTIIYHCISLYKPLRWFTFRAFGYKGNIDFVFYTDTWIRDVRLLEIGKGAYIGNLVTIGTNICKIDNTVLVKSIKIGNGSMIGRLSILGPGVKIGDDCDIGVRNTFGIGVTLENRVKVGAEVKVLHYCRLQEDVRIGNFCTIGERCKIGKGISLPDGVHLPAKKNFETQSDLDKFLSEL